MKRVIQSSIRDVDYYGQSKSRKYGSEISNSLSGSKITTAPRDTKSRGGLKYESKRLNIPYDDFEEALIGMCEDGRAVKLSSEEYLVL